MICGGWVCEVDMYGEVWRVMVCIDVICGV
jgi:hypothetical protein